MEMIEEIDWDGNTVAVRTKKEVKENVLVHKASLVIPRGKNGKFIFAKRGETMEPWPGTWCCGIGGKVSSGQSYEEAAVRESLEEAGVALDVKYVTSFKYDCSKYKAIFQVFTTKDEVEVSSLVPDPREVQHFAALSLDSVKEDVDKDPEKFAPTFVAAFRAFIEAI